MSKRLADRLVRNPGNPVGRLPGAPVYIHAALDVAEAEPTTRPVARRADGPVGRRLCGGFQSGRGAMEVLEQHHDLEEVRALLGNARIDTTQIYTSIRPAQLKRAVEFYEEQAVRKS